MGISRRVAMVEATAASIEQRREAVADAILDRLTDAELEALAGPDERWEGLSDEELLEVARGGPPPRSIADYDPPAWVRARLREVATEEELRVSGWAEEAHG